jgi:type IV pilus assembly protein PilV
MSIKPATITGWQGSHAIPEFCKARGFTLLEALIAFMILSIGMLGIASLQAVSLQAGKTSVYGSVAMMKVEELFESMRANPAVLSTYAGSGANNACTGTKNCSETELAQDDVYWWKQNLKAGLPGAATSTVTVTPAVAPSRMATVKVDISWSERNKDTSQGAASSVTRTYSATTNICTAIPC